MRALIVSKFLHHVGGVETYVNWLANSLAGAGIEVAALGMRPPPGNNLMNMPLSRLWLTPSRDYRSGSQKRVAGALSSIWSPAAGRIMKQAIAEYKPDIIHFHGTCYQLTSAVVRPAAEGRIANVLTAHEYKLICANQTLFSDHTGEICTRCVGASQRQKLIQPVTTRCMKQSLAFSTLGALEGQVSRPTWQGANPHILTPSRFMRAQLLRDGIRPDRITYLDLPWRQTAETVAPRARYGAPGKNVVFIGRLEPIKGVDILIRAWTEIALKHPDAHLRIIGDGQQRNALESLSKSLAAPRVDFLGTCSPSRIRQELAVAAASAHPSRCHENSPYSVRESLMAGVPAVVADVGGMPEMVSLDTGIIVAGHSVPAWSRGLGDALASRRWNHDRFANSVLARAMTDEEHMAELLDVYKRELQTSGQ